LNITLCSAAIKANVKKNIAIAEKNAIANVTQTKISAPSTHSDEAIKLELV
jgi:hypothetical protein